MTWWGGNGGPGGVYGWQAGGAGCDRGWRAVWPGSGRRAGWWSDEPGG